MADAVDMEAYGLAVFKEMVEWSHRVREHRGLLLRYIGLHGHHPWARVVFVWARADEPGLLVLGASQKVWSDPRLSIPPSPLGPPPAPEAIVGMWLTGITEFLDTDGYYLLRDNPGAFVWWPSVPPQEVRAHVGPTLPLELFDVD